MTESCTGLHVETLLNCHRMTCIQAICLIIYHKEFIILFMLEVTLNWYWGPERETSTNRDTNFTNLYKWYML